MHVMRTDLHAQTELKLAEEKKKSFPLTLYQFLYIKLLEMEYV